MYPHTSIGTLQFKVPKDKKFFFEIIDLSNIDRFIPETIHRHEFFEIIIILEGKTRQRVDFNDMRLGEMRFLIIPKGSIHQGSFREKLKGFIILFTPDFLSGEECQFISRLPLFNASYNSRVLTFRKHEWSEISQLLTPILHEYFLENKNHNKIMLRYLLLGLCSKLDELAIQSLDPQFLLPGLVNNFLELLEANFRNQHATNFFAERLKVTPKKLSHTLSGATGKTTQILIADRLILEAKRELYFSDKSIKEIANDLGFEDPLYFSKFFRKHTSLSPRVFKKNFA